MDTSEWLAQAAAFHNATSFAAVSLAGGMDGMSFYVPECMRGAFEDDSELKALHRKTMYVPAASAWVVIAGEKLYELCLGRQGFSPQHWETWKNNFDRIAKEEQVERSARVDAGGAACRMEEIESET